MEEATHAKTRHLVSSVKDSPRTRRREWQLHGGHHKSVQEPRYNRGFMRRPFRSHESLFNDGSGAASALPEHSCLSANSTPRRCSPAFTDQNDYLPLRESFRRSQRYYRRRSSLAQVEMTMALWRQDVDLCGPGESPGPGRRIPVNAYNTSSGLSLPSHPFPMKRHSAPSTTPSAASATAAAFSSSSTSAGAGHEEHEACSSGGTTTLGREAAERRPAEGGKPGGSKIATERGRHQVLLPVLPGQPPSEAAADPRREPALPGERGRGH